MKRIQINGNALVIEQEVGVFLILVAEWMKAELWLKIDLLWLWTLYLLEGGSVMALGTYLIIKPDVNDE